MTDATEHSATISADVNVQEGTLPCIFLNTLPKSASVYIHTLLKEGLRGEQGIISLGYFPYDLIDWRLLNEAVNRGMVTQQHVDPSPMNLTLIKAFLDKIVLHFRDPRQAMLSMYHHINAYRKKAPLVVHNMYPPIPEEYFDMAFSEQLDWQITNYLPACVKWIEDWFDVVDNDDDLDILVMTYEEFTKDNVAYIHRILDFYGISHDRFTMPDIKKETGVHFRKGHTSEWRDVLSDVQKQRAAEILSPLVIERLNLTA